MVGKKDAVSEEAVQRAAAKMSKRDREEGRDATEKHDATTEEVRKLAEDLTLETKSAAPPPPPPRPESTSDRKSSSKSRMWLALHRFACFRFASVIF